MDLSTVLRAGAREKNAATGTHLFTDVTISPTRLQELRKYGYDGESPHFKLREADSNTDVWDTLTPEVVKMMMNPPTLYDPQYQKKVNIAVLTALGALSRK